MNPLILLLLIPAGILLGFCGSGIFDKWQTNKKPYIIGFIISLILYGIILGAILL